MARTGIATGARVTSRDGGSSVASDDTLRVVETAGIALGIASLVVTMAGFTATLLQLRRTASASAAATQAVATALERVLENQTRVLLPELLAVERQVAERIAGQDAAGTIFALGQWRSLSSQMLGVLEQRTGVGPRLLNQLRDSARLAKRAQLNAGSDLRQEEIKQVYEAILNVCDELRRVSQHILFGTEILEDPEDGRVAVEMSSTPLERSLFGSDAGDTESPLLDSQLYDVERVGQWSEIWIASTDLEKDIPGVADAGINFASAVRANIARGVRYTYIVPDVDRLGPSIDAICRPYDPAELEQPTIVRLSDSDWERLPWISGDFSVYLGSDGRVVAYFAIPSTVRRLYQPLTKEVSAQWMKQVRTVIGSQGQSKALTLKT